MENEISIHKQQAGTLNVGESLACLQPLSMSKGLLKKGDRLSNNSSGRV